MRLRGGVSWQITVDEPGDLHLVLFVRDCFGLSAYMVDQPGPLVPNVRDLSELLNESQQRAAAAAWPRWWLAATEVHRSTSPLPPGSSLAEHHRQTWQRQSAVDGPHFESLSYAPELRDAARAAFDPFQLWWAPPLSTQHPPHGRRGGPPRLPGVKGRLIDLHHGRRTIHDVITRIEHELDRGVNPFDLRIEIVAISQPLILTQDEHHAVVSAELVANETDFREWLYTTLHPIA